MDQRAINNLISIQVQTWIIYIAYKYIGLDLLMMITSLVPPMNIIVHEGAIKNSCWSKCIFRIYIYRSEWFIFFFPKRARVLASTCWNPGRRDIGLGPLMSAGSSPAQVSRPSFYTAQCYQELNTRHAALAAAVGDDEASILYLLVLVFSSFHFQTISNWLGCNTQHKKSLLLM